jgi:hypothetical protein
VQARSLRKWQMEEDAVLCAALATLLCRGHQRIGSPAATQACSPSQHQQHRLRSHSCVQQVSHKWCLRAREVPHAPASVKRTICIVQQVSST